MNQSKVGTAYLFYFEASLILFSLLQINHLCRLPDELLDSIFTLAQSSDRSLYLPISKRLLPFLRYYLYHRVRITSYRSLDLFCSTVRIHPLLLDLVTSLSIRIEFIPGRKPAREVRDFGLPSNKTLVDLLSKADGLQRRSSSTDPLALHSCSYCQISWRKLCLNSLRSTSPRLLRMLRTLGTLHTMPNFGDPISPNFASRSFVLEGVFAAVAASIEFWIVRLFRT